MSIKRISKDAILLALLCVTGMFSLPLGDNIKVSLQLLTLFIIWGICDDIWDRILIPALYLVIGLFIPVYAGFQAGITPTFGFVISFVVAGIPFHFIYKYLKTGLIMRYVLACFVSLLVVYIIGTVYLKLYLNIDFSKALLIAVVPYIPFDISKIAICTVILNALPDKIKNPKPEVDQTPIEK
ncbi:MAG: biotin transporter BioY [Erysipelotrichaceae bacterium]|nr:biotin transporter BioY [Erysipelotrichaceae bacterium]